MESFPEVVLHVRLKVHVDHRSSVLEDATSRRSGFADRRRRREGDN